MAQIAMKLNTEPSLNVGHVQTVHEDRYLVLGTMGMISAKRAVGCLLEPQIKDVVLLLLTAESCFILNVLERTQTEPGCLCLPNHTEINLGAWSKTGDGSSSLQIKGDQVKLLAQQDLELQSGSIHIKAKTLGLTAQIMTMRGKLLVQSFAAVRNIFGYLWQKMQSSFGLYDKKQEKVTHLSETLAGQIFLKSESRMELKADHADFKTTKALLLDGKTIHIG